jgi:plastocyanin
VTPLARDLSSTCLLCLPTLACTRFDDTQLGYIQVTIANLEFSPKEINAKLGDAIEWINKDVLVHSATVKGHWNITIAPGKSASLVLSKAGALDYFCIFHPNMKGHITVAQ